MFFGNGTDVGLIAQEAEKVAQELVYEVDGYKYARYDRMTPLLTEAVKELKAEKDAEVGQLKVENGALTARIDNLGVENQELNADNEALRQAVCELNPNAAVCAGV
jgi:hypothetical protein